jgi:hypothetical protein
MFGRKNLDEMSREELVDTIIWLREDNKRLMNEIMHVQNRKLLGLQQDTGYIFTVPNVINSYQEINELKDRLNTLSTEFKSLKEEVEYNLKI